MVGGMHRQHTMTGGKPVADDNSPVQNLGQPGEDRVPTCVALYDFDTRTAGELSFRKGTAIDSTYTIHMLST